VHDWPQDAVGQAIPYGIYEITTNSGYVCIVVLLQFNGERFGTYPAILSN